VWACSSWLTWEWSLREHTIVKSVRVRRIALWPWTLRRERKQLFCLLKSRMKRKQVLKKNGKWSLFPSQLSEPNILPATSEDPVTRASDSSRWTSLLGHFDAISCIYASVTSDIMRRHNWLESPPCQRELLNMQCCSDGPQEDRNIPRVPERGPPSAVPRWWFSCRRRTACQVSNTPSPELHKSLLENKTE